MGKTKQSRKKTKRNVKSTTPTPTPKHDAATVTTYENLDDTDDTFPTTRIMILYKPDDELRVMIQPTRRRNRRTMEAKFVLAAPVNSLENMIEVKEHVDHHQLADEPVL